MLQSVGEQDPVCERVARVAEDNGADLVSCAVSITGATEHGPSVEVVVQTTTGLSLWPVVQARARAGLVPNGYEGLSGPPSRAAAAPHSWPVAAPSPRRRG